MRDAFVETGRGKLQYFEHGSGSEVLVLVHGYGHSGRVWRLVQEYLDTSVFHTIAVSNRGAGESERTNNEDDYTIKSFASDLHGAVTELGLSNFTLIGHSMGAATVTQFALDHPDLLKALVLLDPTPLAGLPLEEGWEAAIREHVARGESPVERVRRSISSMQTQPPADFSAALQADMDRNPIERWIGTRRSVSKIRLCERLGELTLPVLVIGGDQDFLVGQSNILAEYLSLGLANRFLHVFHGVGHAPNMFAPRQLVDVLDGFVTRTLPAISAET